MENIKIIQKYAKGIVGISNLTKKQYIMTNMARFYIDHMALGVFNGLTIVTIVTY